MAVKTSYEGFLVEAKEECNKEGLLVKNEGMQAHLGAKGSHIVFVRTSRKRLQRPYLL